MPHVNLNLREDQLDKATSLANTLKLNRSAFLRDAINHYIYKIERELLAERFKKASQKCRDESLAVCQEFENIDQIPE